jgi:hypothetical protein
MMPVSAKPRMPASPDRYVRWSRPGWAWIEQCSTIAALAVAAAVLNWLTTGDHLIRSLSYRHLWAIAGMDLLLLVGAAIAALTAWKLRLRTIRSPSLSESTPLHRASS